MWTLLKNNLWVRWILIVAVLLFLLILKNGSGSSQSEDNVILSEVQPRSFQVDVHTVGELEAARSTIIASTIRGELGKVIFLATDGANVQKGDTLVKMDPTPFEEKVGELQSKIQDQSAMIKSYLKTLKWERSQAELENTAAAFELESAELELEKTLKGDGPLELFRLQSALQKANVKFEELNAYSQDLAVLEEQGYINHSERKQAEKKLKEEQEGYENALLQFETYSNHVHPMVVKKAESALRRAKLRIEEVAKAGDYKVEKARATLLQAKQLKRDLESQLHIATNELEQSEIRAPSQGMVVQREEYRASQKRKPRVGDILVKNQPILDLPDLNSMIVKTKVREVDLYKVKIGKPASIEVDAYPQVYFKGNVQSIGVLALSDAGRSGVEKYFEVKVAMQDSDARLRPGMTARVAIFSDKVDQVPSVPVPAIFENNKRPCCYVMSYGNYKVTPVKLGTNNEQWVQIIDGVKLGDQVALTTPPQDRIIEENL